MSAFIKADKLLQQSQEERGETPFKYVMRVEFAWFVHHRALCNFLVSDTCLQHYKQPADVSRVRQSVKK